MLNINKNRILELYYEKHLTGKEIATKLKVSQTCITNLIKTDPRYVDEKNYRKTITAEKHTSRTKQYVKEQREKQFVMDSILRKQHLQASIELSTGHGISNRAFRKCNSSAYTYDSQKKCFEFNETLGRSYAVPKVVR